MFEESLDKIFRKVLIEFDFQFPITFVWVGINGRVFTGRFEVKSDKTLRSVVLSGNPGRLGFPINVMLVDSKGEAVHIVFKSSMDLGKMNRCRVDGPPPPVPSGWAGGAGKA